VVNRFFSLDRDRDERNEEADHASLFLGNASAPLTGLTDKDDEARMKPDVIDDWTQN
jgi:hypothetical protein